MLVVTRKQGEGIWIGNHTFVSIKKISGRKVQIAVDARECDRILRDEIVREHGFQERNGDGSGTDP